MGGFNAALILIEKFVDMPIRLCSMLDYVFYQGLSKAVGKVLLTLKFGPHAAFQHRREDFA